MARPNKNLVLAAMVFAVARAAPRLVHDVQVAFAHSTQTVFYVMAGVMAATFLVAVRGLPRGKVEAPEYVTEPAMATTPPA